MSEREEQKLQFIDVFSGCGGLSLGLSQAGLRGLFAIERNESAFETFEANFLAPNSVYKFQWPPWLPKEAIGIEELMESHEAELAGLEGMIDVLAGGPPCQGFSSAGRRRVNDPRNQLFKSYLKLVDMVKPRAVLIENVRGFTVDFQSASAKDNYSSMLTEALSDEYQVKDALLNLSSFGVPQNRVRYFVLAFRKGLKVGEPFNELSKMLPGFLRALGLQAPVSSWAAISDLEISRCGEQASSESAGFTEINYVGPRTKYQRLMATESGPGDLRLARHSKAVLGRFAELIELCRAEGRLNISISESLRQKFGLKKRALRVLDPDRPSPTITSMPDDLIHYKEPRILTVRENARLQSFPDWFAFKGKYTTGGKRRRHEVPRYTQVANAVPPLAGRAIGTVIAKILQANLSAKSLSGELDAVPELAKIGA
ncbi:DNA cytosine methyltransferase [Mesorhizobium sp. M0058]|uniref:DNA cytosine methyltransferase n=1 Tax=Mesorhizobium sp. M0058 TaxID=2956865 RepID=UPI00333C34F6